MRHLSVIDGLFLLFLGLRLSGVRPDFSFFEIFSPYIFELVFLVASRLYAFSGLTERVTMWVWKRKIKSEIKQAVRKSQNSNPGKKYDPELNP